MPVLRILSSAAIAAMLASPAPADHWVDFEDVTAQRLVAPSDVGADDMQEKDYAVGDVDQDGDDDVVVVRKQPWTTTGRYRNVLLMNEGLAEGHPVDGVLVDRTAEYASASDIPGDEGFLTPTNDRDVALVDVDNDGWLDIVTAVALGDDLPKHISHPRVYHNLGEQDGAWLGFRYEDARIPQMHPTAGPRFGAVAAGDVTGDGFADLYFGDYDSGGPQVFDFNNRLLINDGTGHFTDETDYDAYGRLTPEMSNSSFGSAAAIADVNNDGVADIIKLTALASPVHIAVTYNDPQDEGYFTAYDVVYQLAGYWVNPADLDGDGLLDLVVSDNGSDRYLLNEGLDEQGHADFSQHVFPDSGGFTTNSAVADLNNDGFVDVIITDVDDDIPGCSRTTKFYRNVGGTPVAFMQQGFPLEEANSTGVHDVAVLDLDGDGWLDLVVGRCSGTRVYLNTPPPGLVFAYPQGLPTQVVPGEATDVVASVLTTQGQAPEITGGRLVYTLDGEAPAQVAMSVEGNVLSGALPALECLDGVSFHVRVFLADGQTYADPPSAPEDEYHAIAAADTEIALRDELEGDTSGWQVVNEPGLAAGGWEVAEPNGTITTSGAAGAPGEDATGGEGVLCFVTRNGPPGGAASDDDVDGGPTRLVSPVLDLEGVDAILTWSLWYTSEFGSPDPLTVELTGDGTTWTTVPELATTGTGGAWETVSLRVGDHIVPTANVQVRFSVTDEPNDSVTEAGIDNFQVETILCDAPCPADATGDGAVDVDDLVAVIGGWGPCGPDCPADVTGDGIVDVNDLVAVIGAWGGCGPG